MKLHLMAPAFLFVGLVACSKETSAPPSTMVQEQPATAAPAPAPEETEGLSHLPDQLSAEEIQARREAWVSGGASSGTSASSTTAVTAGASAARVAAAPASRE